MMMNANMILEHDFGKRTSGPGRRSEVGAISGHLIFQRLSTPQQHFAFRAVANLAL